MLRLSAVAWPGPIARLDPQSRLFAVALAASIAIHAFVLSIQFRFPEATRRSAPNTLDVVFVNSKTRSQPLKPEVLAQVNLDGGGNTDQKRRAKTPLPVIQSVEPRDNLAQTSERQRELEVRQQELLTQVQAQPRPGPAVAEQARPSVEPQRPSGIDLAQKALAIARLEAEISRSFDEYAKRPRKHFVGARAAEYRFAQYVEDWRLKIERIGNLNYPESARGRLYGSLRLSVSIYPDGSLAGLELERASGHKVLDHAAQRIVQMSAPFAKFPRNISRDTDILVITRTWHFAPGDKLLSD